MMYFIGFTLVVLSTFIITTFASMQIIGIILFKLPKKEFIFLIGALFWGIILILLNLLYTYVFKSYFDVYFWCSIIALVISLLNIGNLKRENDEQQWNIQDNFK